MTWALRRQIFYITILLVFCAGLGFLVLYPYLNRPPTCTDNKKNGDETGVDCGGSCALACSFEVDNVSVIWARSFEVVPGRYNAVAYLENKNKTAAVQNIHYRFRFADKDNLYIGKREGSTYIPTGGKFAVFEPAVDMGNSIPIYTSFEFTEYPIWIQVPEQKINDLKITTSEIKLADEKSSPRLSALIKNNSLFSIPLMKVIAILYDATGNAVSVSSTNIDEIRKGETKEVNFTWRQPIQEGVVLKEIIPMFDVFSVKLK